MKKFLIFLVSIVVVVSLGLTTFYFIRNDEVISIKTKEIYCNAGDSFSLDSLGITRFKPHYSTSFNYNAGGEDVTSKISYDKEAKQYTVSDETAGDVELIISTSNEKYKKFKVLIHVGNGSDEHPYYVFAEDTLSKIGNSGDDYLLSESYILMSNIALSSHFAPIGSASSGFSGELDGNGYTISGLELNSDTYANAGLFYSLDAGSKVYDLTIADTKISGAYEYAGVLAGVISGDVSRVAVKNASIVNTLDNGVTGAFAGNYDGTKCEINYVDGAKLTIGGENKSVVGAKVGGFFGIIDRATAVATYANNINIDMTNAEGTVGGYAGSMNITSEAGSIQQSYANAVCGEENFAGFVGEIVSIGNDFDTSKTMLRHLIGNIAIVNGDTDIVDTDVVAVYDNDYFKINAELYTNKNVFYNAEASLYMVRGFASVEEVVNTNSYVFYAIDKTNKTAWDTDYVWNISGNGMPTLTMSNVSPSQPSGEYFRRDLGFADITDDPEDKNNIYDLFASDLNNVVINLTASDVIVFDNWTPINVVNSTINGNNATIRVNLANSKDGILSLFSTVDNSTIENLNIIVTNASSSDAYIVAGLAGIITSSDEMSSASIKNVNVTFESITAKKIAHFGGLAGLVESANIEGCSVTGINLTSYNQVSNAGAVVAVLTSGSIKDITVNATLYSNLSAGVVADNSGTIANVSGNINITMNSLKNSLFAGAFAGNNHGTIIDSNISVKIELADKSRDYAAYLAGVAGYNHNGTISNVTITGEGISVAKAVGGKVQMAGVTTNNHLGTIENVYNFMARVGTYHEGREYNVAGLVVNNSGKIIKSIASSDLNGNYVGGIVVSSVDTRSVIDQVLVGKFDLNTKEITANTIKGDKLIAGVAVNLNYGAISNVQAESRIMGTKNTTRSSLVVLVFPDSASMSNSTINSSLVGVGTKYRESWTDYAQVEENNSMSTKYNIYDDVSSAGIMSSVVINLSKSGVIDAKGAMGIVNRFAIVIPVGNTYNGNSYVKYVSDEEFNNSLSFVGEFTFNCAYNNLFKTYHTATKTLTFDTTNIWTSNNGITLSFLANV